MDMIKKLLFVFIFIITLASPSAFCHEIKQIHTLNGTISAPKHIDNDILNTRNKEISINSSQNNQTIISNRRNNDSQGNSTNNYAFIPAKQFNKLITYIQDESYLEKNSQLALRLLLFQIQPNAP